MAACPLCSLEDFSKALRRAGGRRLVRTGPHSGACVTGPHSGGMCDRSPFWGMYDRSPFCGMCDRSPFWKTYDAERSVFKETD